MRTLFSGLALAVLLGFTHPAAAQKQGGTLRIFLRDTPPGPSIHEEATISTVAPFMALFNNLVVFDQSAPTQRARDDRARPGRELELG